MRKTSGRAGFSLLEMTIVLTIIGSMSAGLIVLANKKVESNKYDITTERLKTIDDALTAYSQKGWLLPCPASPSAAENSADFGSSDDCSQGAPTKAGITALNTGTNEEVWVGVVPTRALNLPDAAMFDGWGNRLRYAVLKKLATDSTDFTDFASTVTTGGIQVNDGYGNQVLPASDKSVVSYVLVSFGMDGKGAITRRGTSTGVTCPAASTVKSEENCDGDAVFNDATYNNGTVVAEQYDDLIRWKPLYRIRSTAVEAAATASCNAPASDGKKLSAGNTYTCAVDNQHDLYCWGSNLDGQLGDGTTGNTCSPAANGCNQPKKIGAFSDWDYVATDMSHSCGVRGGLVYCWGDNTDGKLGVGDTADRSSPTQVTGGTPSITDWVKVSVDGAGTCGLRGNGDAYCWGDNAYGQLGDGTTTDRNVPTKVTMGDWSDITNGSHTSCGIRCGKAYCWGNNSYGSIGNGTTTNSAVPVEVSGGYSDWVKIANNDDNFTCGLRSNNRIYCWGSGDLGQLGNGTWTPTETTPVEISGGFSDWVDVFVGTKTACGMRSAGQLYCWGDNTYGQIGNGTAPTHVNTPTQVTGTWTEFSLTGYSVCGIRTDNKGYCWGRGHRYQLGDGNTYAIRNPPVQVMNLNF